MTSSRNDETIKDFKEKQTIAKKHIVLKGQQTNTKNT